MIENWKDTAFGSDFGGDFLELVEKISHEEISMELIYQNTDLKRLLEHPNLLKKRTDNNVNFTHSKFKQYIHFEDLIIALSAMIAEHGLNGKIDLTKAYGSKVLSFKLDKAAIKPIYSALQKIYSNPENYVLFEMCMGEERDETLKDIKEILTEFEKLIK